MITHTHGHFALMKPILLIITLLLLCISVTCTLNDPQFKISDLYDFIIENRTDMTLSIYIEHLHEFTLEPRQKDVATVVISNEWIIVAKNTENTTIFAQEFTREEVERDSEIVNNTYTFTLNITNSDINNKS